MIYLLFTFSSAFRCCLSCGFLTFFFFFLKNPPTTEIYPLPLHAPFPIYRLNRPKRRALGAALSEGVAGIERGPGQLRDHQELQADGTAADDQDGFACRYAGLLDGFQNRVDESEEHTSELQSRLHLVCRLLLEKKKTSTQPRPPPSRHRAPPGRDAGCCDPASACEHGFHDVVRLPAETHARAAPPPTVLGISRS